MMARKSYKKWDKQLDKHGNKRFVTINARIMDMGVLAKTLGVDRNGPIQNHYTDLIMRNLRDFMPQETGQLVAKMSRESSTRIRVDGPYARFLFFGLTKEGAPVKYDNANPLGTSHWDRRMAAARGRAIASEMSAYAIGRRR